MCSEFIIKTNLQEVATELHTEIHLVSQNKEWDQRVKFTNLSPVVALHQGKLGLGELIFPANPFPNARLSQVDGDQIRRIYEVPLWKESFTKFPCIIPVTSFLEPAYWGDHQGDVMEFKEPGSKLLFVPGIVIKPRVPATGKMNGFAMLTHTASEQMLDYHHRMLMFLKPKAAVEYLELDTKEPRERFEFLIENRLVPKFQIKKDRTMSKGWEKRVEHHIHSLNDEKKYRSTLKQEAVLG